MNRSLACWLALAMPVLAQDVAWIATGSPDRHLTGRRVIGIGDIDGDGHEDALTIVDGACGTVVTNGLLWVISGRTGQRLREVPSACPNCRFASIAAAGDMNGDGVPDYVATQGSASPVPYFATEVRSGADDSILWSVSTTMDQVLSDLDLNGDGLKDLVLCDWHAQNYLGEMLAYSNGGTLLYGHIGDVSPTANPPMTIGNCLAKLGDVDNDGGDDFVMGCWDMQGRGVGVIVSGRTGAYIRFCYGELPGDGIGINATPCGDLDADGYTDFATGNGGFGNRGVVRAFSSQTGQVLHQWTAPPIEFAKSLGSRGADLDGDGLADVVVGAPSAGLTGSVQGAIYVFSGRTGAQLQLTTGQPAPAGYSGFLGYWATTLKPPAGENTGLFLVPNPNTLPGLGTTCQHTYGVIVAYRGLPRTSVMLGPPCPGNLPLAPQLGMASLGANGVRIHLSDAPANSLAVLLLGLSTTSFLGVPLPAALDPLGLPGCSLRTSIELMQAAIAGTVGNDRGYAFVDVNQPVPAAGLGTWSVSAQWLVLGDASSFPGGMTQAIQWRR